MRVIACLMLYPPAQDTQRADKTTVLLHTETMITDLSATDWFVGVAPADLALGSFFLLTDLTRERCRAHISFNNERRRLGFARLATCAERTHGAWRG